MALGAVVMLAGLAAAAFYLPKHNKTEATTTTTATTDTTKPVPPPTQATKPPAPTPQPAAPNPAATKAAARDAQIKLEASLAAKQTIRNQQLMARNNGAPGPNRSCASGSRACSRRSQCGSHGRDRTPG